MKSHQMPRGNPNTPQQTGLVGTGNRRRPKKPRPKPDGLTECQRRLSEAAELIRVLGRLSDGGDGHVMKAVRIMTICQTTRESKVYQSFLFDILRNAGRVYVVLCASALGKQRVVQLSERIRTCLVRHVKDKKDILYCPVLETLAEQVPSQDDPQLVEKLAGRSRSNKEARQNSEASPTISTGSTNTSPPNETQRESTATSKFSQNNPNNPNFTTAQEHRVVGGASIQGITDIFDEYICNAIRRDTSSKAAITMEFPDWGLLDCLMSLDINQSEVGYLAMALFKVRVESVGEVRYISLSGGVRLMPNPEVTLKGVLDGAVIDIFGFKIHDAITACSLRRRELEEGSPVTDCVSMILTGSLNEGAIINLSLGLEEGIQIRDKLYS